MKYIVGDLVKYKDREWKVTGVDTRASGRYTLQSTDDGTNLGHKAWKVDKGAELLEAAPRPKAESTPWWKKLFGKS